MNTNTLENFCGIFFQDTYKFLKTLSFITPHLTERNIEITKYLSFQTPEFFWLVRKLNFEYDKLFPDKIELLQNFIKQLAHSSAFTIHETGTENFAVNNTKYLINNTINNIVDNDDIISIANSISPDMDTLDEDDIDSSVNQIHNKLPSSLANFSPRPSTAVKINAFHKQ
ncbi:571_t:CDS:1 [Funneliformis geosporum]|nr:571_t:CDS:1 [Funneliformis geosporum]